MICQTCGICHETLPPGYTLHPQRIKGRARTWAQEHFLALEEMCQRPVSSCDSSFTIDDYDRLSSVFPARTLASLMDAVTADGNDLSSTSCDDAECINATLMMFARACNAFQPKSYSLTESCYGGPMHEDCFFDADETDCSLCGQEGGEEGNRWYKDEDDRSASCPISMHPTCVSYQKSAQGRRTVEGKYLDRESTKVKILKDSCNSHALHGSIPGKGMRIQLAIPLQHRRKQPSSLASHVHHSLP